MPIQVQVSMRVPDPGDAKGEKMLDLGTVNVRVQQKVTVQHMVDGKPQNTEAWQDQQLRPVTNESVGFMLNSNQRLIMEEPNG